MRNGHRRRGRRGERRAARLAVHAAGQMEGVGGWGHSQRSCLSGCMPQPAQAAPLRVPEWPTQTLRAARHSCGPVLVRRACMQAKGAQLIVALTHMREPNDRKLAAEVPEIHLVLGGHDHHYVVDYIEPHMNLMVKSGEHGMHAGLSPRRCMAALRALQSNDGALHAVHLCSCHAHPPARHMLHGCAGAAAMADLLLARVVVCSGQWRVAL